MGENPEDLDLRGRLLTDAGRFEEALDCFERAIAMSPNDPDLWCDRGALLWKMQRNQDAHDSVLRALAIDPTHPHSCFNQGIGFLENGIADEAITWFDRVLSSDPHHGEAWHNKGEALFRLRRFGEARSCFAEGVRCGNLLSEQGLRACKFATAIDNTPNSRPAK
jgi:Flp pilus assembly protein TadD